MSVSQCGASALLINHRFKSTIEVFWVRQIQMTDPLPGRIPDTNSIDRFCGVNSEPAINQSEAALISVERA